MKYWLMKSEPGAYSLDDLRRDGTTPWDGVRNYQARNFMRDDMKVGDKVLFYHSNATPPHVAGIAVVSRESYPDYTAFDPKDMHYDPKSDPENPRWFMVDVQFVETLQNPVSLEQIKATKSLSDMVLVQRSRLSVQPVTKQQFDAIVRMGKG